MFTRIELDERQMNRTGLLFLGYLAQFGGLVYLLARILDHYRQLEAYPGELWELRANIAILGLVLILAAALLYLVWWDYHIRKM